MGKIYQGLDAAASYFFERELERIRAQMLEVKYPDGTKSFRFVPINTEASPFDEQFVSRKVDYVGEAQWVSDKATDAPVVDVKADEEKVKIYTAGASFIYSRKEIGKSNQVGRSLPRAQAEAARKLIMRKIDNAIALGDTSIGMEGFLNSSLVTDTDAAATGTGGSKLWSDKDPDDIINDINLSVGRIMAHGIDDYEPNAMLVAPEDYAQLKNTPRSSGSDKSLLNWISSEFGLQVDKWSKLKDLGGGGTNRMVIYKKDPEILEAPVPEIFTQFEPVYKGYFYAVPCQGSTAGCIIHHPLAIDYTDAI